MFPYPQGLVNMYPVMFESESEESFVLLCVCFLSGWPFSSSLFKNCHYHRFFNNNLKMFMKWLFRFVGSCFYLFSCIISIFIFSSVMYTKLFAYLMILFHNVLVYEVLDYQSVLSQNRFVPLSGWPVLVIGPFVRKPLTFCAFWFF